MNEDEVFFNNDEQEIVPSKRSIRGPKIETMAKIAGGVGTVLFHGSKTALKVARIGANLASKGINAISKSDILKKTVPSLLTLGATIPLTLISGLGNMVVFRKKPDFLNNALRWKSGIKQLTTPVINDIIAPILEASSGIVDKVTEKSLVERISEATGGQIPPEQVSKIIGEHMSFIGGQVAGIGGKIAEGLFGKKSDSIQQEEETSIFEM